jgi:hypothetical protein
MPISTFALCSPLKIEVGIIQVLNQLYICDDFDLELKEFKLRMMA